MVLRISQPRARLGVGRWRQMGKVSCILHLNVLTFRHKIVFFLGGGDGEGGAKRNRWPVSRMCSLHGGGDVSAFVWCVEGPWFVAVRHQCRSDLFYLLVSVEWIRHKTIGSSRVLKTDLLCSSDWNPAEVLVRACRFPLHLGIESTFVLENTQRIQEGQLSSFFSLDDELDMRVNGIDVVNSLMTYGRTTIKVPARTRDTLPGEWVRSPGPVAQSSPQPDPPLLGTGENTWGLLVSAGSRFLDAPTEPDEAYHLLDGWMNQAYSRLSTTHGHIADCKLLVCMYWTRIVLVRPAASLYSASPLKHNPTGKQ